MKTYIILILVLMCTFSIRAQVCSCPADINSDNEGLPNKVFRFSNGKELGICGYTAVETDTSYTKFTLFECGSNKPVETWDVTRTCQVEQVKDELIIKEMFGLPIGQSFSTLWRPFLIHKYSYKNGTLQETEYYRKDLDRYNKQQMEQVFAEYKKLPEGSKQNMMHVANMLFWAAFCGNTEAEADLKSMPEKFGPFEGVIGEEWKAIYGTYERWKGMTSHLGKISH